MAAGMVMGALSTAGTGYGMAATWPAVTGLGMGVTLPASMTAAMGALSAERGGVGSAVLMTLRLVVGAFGAAVLGSLLSAAYRGHVDVAGLPPAAAGAAREKVGGGPAVAGRLHDAGLPRSVHAAFVRGMDVTLFVGAGVMVLSAALAVILLPRRRAEEDAVDGQSDHEYASA